MGKFFLEIGVKYKQIHNGGWCMIKNITSRYRDIFILTRGLKNRSQKLHFERDLSIPQTCCIKKKVGDKGLD